MAGLRRRAQTDRFDGTELEEALKAYARIKDNTFDWEMGAYAKTRRSQSPDRAGLEKYAPLLSTILSFAPGGFPNHGLLRDVLISLDSTYIIRSKDVPATKSRMDWANDVADTIRLATRHIVDLKKSGTSYLPPILRDLVGLVKLDADPDMHAPPIPISWQMPEPAAALPPPPRRLAAKTSNASIASSVIFCGVRCRCPLCTPAEDIDSSQGSATSMAAAQAEPVVASRGGQKRLAREMRGNDAEPVMQKPAGLIYKKPAAANLSKKPANAFKVVHRKSPEARAEAYIMHNNKFLTGMTRAKSESYHTAVLQVAAELESGALLPDAARQRIYDLAA